jgi:GR25 family glycosyltransferase involved in LPS biosynthesis
MTQSKSSVFGDLFDRVVVINLSRRADRMSSLRSQLDMLGMDYVRFPAIDGRSPETASAWQAYSAQALVPQPGEGAVENWRDFYLGDRTRQARVAFFEAQSGRKAIASAGAWGLFQSMKAVLEQAVKDRVESLLILEDDVLFHKDTVSLWPAMQADLPDDWRILQLGAMQLHWEQNWIDWHSDRLYLCNGSSLAAHAVALRGETIAEVLAACDTPDLPFDIGALQEVKRRHREACFTCYPNLAIQDAKDTEIGMSKIFFRESRKEKNVYRWTWSDYGPAVLRRFAPGKSAKTDRPTDAGPTHAAPKPKPDAATSPSPAGKPAPKPPGKPKHLHPYGDTCPQAVRIIAVVSETPDAVLDGHLDLLARQRDNAVAAPIIVIDDLALVPKLRERRLAFEYVPSLETYERTLNGGLHAEVAVLQRLALIRRKWAPSRILSFGDVARERLDAWRVSPFEANAIGPDLHPDAGAQAGSASAAPST